MLGLISLILILLIPVIFIWLSHRSNKRFRNFHWDHAGAWIKISRISPKIG